MLHSSIHWPKEGLVEDLVKGVESYILRIINISSNNLGISCVKLKFPSFQYFIEGKTI